jgi:heme a synthase
VGSTGALKRLMDNTALYDFSPLLRLALLGAVLALGPLAWVWLRHRNAAPPARLRALTLFTLFLCFDLVLFGAFTRLTDSGLGCPDWPGCYGSASPLGAQEQIRSAQAALPSGPVTHRKAWIEMVHRYLAMAVGVLIMVIAAVSWLEARRRRAAISPWLATATLVWVCIQGAFGALTVTMKLYPAVVTAHLLGGFGLLALLAVQAQRYQHTPLHLPGRLHRAAWLVMGLSVAQVVLGGWVSTNYAVLACTDFPTCQGDWWPAMDFANGFTVMRELGVDQNGSYLPFASLTAIHVTHRMGAVVVLFSVVLLVWRLLASGDASLRRWAWALAGAVLWQVASGFGNVVLGWPLVAALAHTGGAAVLITLLAVLLARAAQSRPRRHPIPCGPQAQGAS